MERRLAKVFRIDLEFEFRWRFNQKGWDRVCNRDWSPPDCPPVQRPKGAKKSRVSKRAKASKAPRGYKAVKGARGSTGRNARRSWCASV